MYPAWSRRLARQRMAHRWPCSLRLQSRSGQQPSLQRAAGLPQAQRRQACLLCQQMRRQTIRRQLPPLRWLGSSSCRCSWRSCRQACLCRFLARRTSRRLQPRAQGQPPLAQPPALCNRSCSGRRASCRRHRRCCSGCTWPAAHCTPLGRHPQRHSHSWHHRRCLGSSHRRSPCRCPRHSRRHSRLPPAASWSAQVPAPTWQTPCSRMPPATARSSRPSAPRPPIRRQAWLWRGQTRRSSGRRQHGAVQMQLSTWTLHLTHTCSGARRRCSRRGQQRQPRSTACRCSSQRHRQLGWAGSSSRADTLTLRLPVSLAVAARGLKIARRRSGGSPWGLDTRGSQQAMRSGGRPPQLQQLQRPAPHQRDPSRRNRPSRGATCRLLDRPRCGQWNGVKEGGNMAMLVADVPAVSPCPPHLSLAHTAGARCPRGSRARAPAPAERGSAPGSPTACSSGAPPGGRAGAAGGQQPAARAPAAAGSSWQYIEGQPVPSAAAGPANRAAAGAASRLGQAGPPAAATCTTQGARPAGGAAATAACAISHAACSRRGSGCACCPGGQPAAARAGAGAAAGAAAASAGAADAVS